MHLFYLFQLSPLNAHVYCEVADVVLCGPGVKLQESRGTQILAV